MRLFKLLRLFCSKACFVIDSFQLPILQKGKEKEKRKEKDISSKLRWLLCIVLNSKPILFRVLSNFLKAAIQIENCSLQL